MKTTKEVFFERKTKCSFRMLLLMIFCFAIGSSNVYGQFCGWNSNYDPQLQDPAYIEYIQEMLDATEEAANKIAGESELMTVQIPIVFHIVHKGTSVGNGDNIPYSDVEAAFNRLNADFDGTGISFCMAQRDELGNQLDDETDDPSIPEPQAGVVRVDASVLPEYTNSGIPIGSQLEYQVKTLGPQFSNYSYLNVWVVSSILGQNTNGVIQGVAYMPNTTAPEIDGIMMKHSIFNVSTNRVLTHEVGHYLGLFHTFQGDDSDFDGIADTCPSATAVFPDSDEIADTDPHQRSASGTCPTGDNLCNEIGSNTGIYTQLEDITNNHMDYSVESCRVNFTDDQVMHMMGTIDCHRKGLTHSLGCEEGCPILDIFPLDFTVDPENPISNDNLGQNGEEATFEIASNLTTYQWYVDGVMQTVENGKLGITFDSPGDHVVCIRSEQNGCEIETCKTIMVYLGGLCYDPVLEPCEVLLNGDFSQNILDSDDIHIFSPSSDPNIICNWQNAYGSPWICNFDSEKPYVGFWTANNSENEFLATSNQLNFQNGGTYRLSFEYAAFYDLGPQQENITLQFGFSPKNEAINDIPVLIDQIENINASSEMKSNNFVTKNLVFQSFTTEFTYFDNFGGYLVFGNKFQTNSTFEAYMVLIRDVSIKECDYCGAQPNFSWAESACNEFTFVGSNLNPDAPGFITWSVDGITLPQFTGSTIIEDYNFPVLGEHEVCMNITCPNGITIQDCQMITTSSIVNSVACESPCWGAQQVDVEAQRCGDNSNEIVVENFAITVPKGYGPCGTNIFFTDTYNGDTYLNDYYIDDTGQTNDVIYISFTIIVNDINAQIGTNFTVCSPDGLSSRCFRLNVDKVNTCDECSSGSSMVANFVVNCMDGDLTDNVFVYSGSFDFDPPILDLVPCKVTSSNSGTTGFVGQSTDNGDTFPVTFDISTNSEGAFNSQVTLCFYDEDNDKTYCYDVDINVSNPCISDPDGCEIDIPPVTIICNEVRNDNAVFIFSYALHMPEYINDGYVFCDPPITGRDLITYEPVIELEENVTIQVPPTISKSNNAYIFSAEIAVPCDQLDTDPTSELIVSLCDENGNEACVDIDLRLECDECNTSGKSRNFSEVEINDFEIFPNPAYSVFNIIAPESKMQQSFTIYSPNGRIMTEGLLYKGQNIINLAEATSGLYLIRMQNGDKIDMKKIMIIK